MLDKKGNITYTQNDLMRLCNINTFGQYSSVIAGLINHVRQLEREIKVLKEKDVKADSSRS
jgi:hypothetical protein